MYNLIIFCKYCLRRYVWPQIHVRKEFQRVFKNEPKNKGPQCLKSSLHTYSRPGSQTNPSGSCFMFSADKVWLPFHTKRFLPAMK